MRKRKINPQYLKNITSQDVRNGEISALDFAMSLKRFADEYLGGIIQLGVEGSSTGSVSLKLPVASYLIRLLCECGDNDDIIKATLSLSDKLSLKVEYESPSEPEEIAYIVRVAKLAGFSVTREGDTLIFDSDIKLGAIMQVYAVSSDEFFTLLVITHKM